MSGYKTALRRQVLISLLLFTAALVPRLLDIIEPAPQTDELHWRSRSAKIIDALRHHNYDKATSHLGHPGIPPAFVMAAGEWIAWKHNNIRSLNREDAAFIDELSGCRIANATASALLAPAVYVIASGFMPQPLAIAAAVFSLSDAQHIAISRIAHLDSFMAVLCVLCIYFYGAGVIRRSLAHKLTAGVFWGLCIATKPTAVALLPAFVIWKLVRNMLAAKENDSGERQLLSWSDVWAFLTAHAVLAALFTRLWLHNSDYRLRLGIKSIVAGKIYKSGMWLHTEWLFTSAAVAVLLAAAAYLLFKQAKKRRVFFHLAMFLLLAAAFAASLAAVPQVFENIVRFWVRTMGLSGMHHRSFGYTWPTPPLGYIGILASKLSTISLLSLVAGIIFFVLQLRRRIQSEAGRYETIWLSLFGITAVVWIGILGVSSKQAFRYILPVLPGLYFFAAVGFLKTWEVICAGLGLTKLIRRPGAVAALGVAVLVIARSAIAASVHPDYLLVYNSLSGGLKGAMTRGYQLPLGGYEQALKFLHERTKDWTEEAQVATFADIETVRAVYKRIYPLESQRHLRFVFVHNVHAADYVFVSHTLIPMFERRKDLERSSLRELYAYNVEGVKLTSILEVPYLDYASPERRSLAGAFRTTGRVQVSARVAHTDESTLPEVVLAMPSKYEPGALFFGEFVHFKPGDYSIDFSIALAADAPSNSRAIKLEVGPGCTRLVNASELEPRRFKPIRLECSFRSNYRAQLRGFWAGEVPLAVESVTLSRRSGALNTAAKQG